MCWPGGQHLLLAVDQVAGVKRGQLKAVTVRNRVGGASLDAITTENASVVVDVVNLGVALGAAHAIFGGVVGSLDIDAVRGTVGGAEKAGDALLEAVFVALQHVRAAEAGFDPGAAQRPFAIGIIFDRGGLEHLHEGDAHALRDRSDIFDDRHVLLVYRAAKTIVGR